MKGRGSSRRGLATAPCPAKRAVPAAQEVDGGAPAFGEARAERSLDEDSTFAVVSRVDDARGQERLGLRREVLPAGLVRLEVQIEGGALRVFPVHARLDTRGRGAPRQAEIGDLQASAPMRREDMRVPRGSPGMSTRGPKGEGSSPGGARLSRENAPAMSAPPPALTTRSGRRLLAPRWHTAGLVGILLLTFAAGALLQRKAGPGPGIAPQHQGAIKVYVTALLLDWALFYYVWAFASKSGTTLREIVGGRWASAADVLRDVAIAVPFWVVWHMTAVLVHRLLGPSTAKTVDVLLPESAAEIAVWIAVCLTAGFCEEAVFRGYLQTQIRALTGSATVAVAAQAICFGVAHGYQGTQNVIVITVLGALYGVLALWRRSTRPGMLAHAWSDFYGGMRMQFLNWGQS